MCSSIRTGPSFAASTSCELYETSHGGNGDSASETVASGASRSPAATGVLDTGEEIPAPLLGLRATARPGAQSVVDLPKRDVARGRNRPGGGPAGLVPFCTERCCDLTVGAASSTMRATAFCSASIGPASRSSRGSNSPICSRNWAEFTDKHEVRAVDRRRVELVTTPST